MLFILNIFILKPKVNMKTYILILLTILFTKIECSNNTTQPTAQQIKYFKENIEGFLNRHNINDLFIKDMLNRLKKTQTPKEVRAISKQIQTYVLAHTIAKEINL